jgi:DNA-binding MarR family transcriptional regulator
MSQSAHASANDTSASVFDLLSWEISRAHYAYIGLAERFMMTTPLANRVQPGMGLVLFALFEKNGLSIKEIVGRTRLAHSTLSGVLTRMEAAGLLKRIRDTVDARVVRIHLTAAAKAMEADCLSTTFAFNEIIESGLGKKRAAAAKQIFRKLIYVLKKAEEKLAREQARRSPPPYKPRRY